jgi:multidrug efflux pump
VLKRREGLSIFDAAVEAARLRLHPIIMTSFAFVLGCLPLAAATDASAGSRHSIGTGVIGGLLAATLIAIFFIPLFFTLLERFSERFFPPRAQPRGAGVRPSPVAPGEEQVHGEAHRRLTPPATIVYCRPWTEGNAHGREENPDPS